MIISRHKITARRITQSERIEAGRMLSALWICHRRKEKIK